MKMTTMTPEAMKATVTRAYAEVWSRGNVALVDELYAEDYVNCDPVTPGVVVRGAAAFKGLVGSYRTAFPDLTFSIEQQLVEGDTVVSRWKAVGTHKGPLMGAPATGRLGTAVDGVTLTRFRDGKIVEDRAVWDALGLLRQLGIVQLGPAGA